MLCKKVLPARGHARLRAAAAELLRLHLCERSRATRLCVSELRVFGMLGHVSKHRGVYIRDSFIRPMWPESNHTNYDIIEYGVLPWQGVCGSAGRSNMCFKIPGLELWV